MGGKGRIRQNDGGIGQNDGEEFRRWLDWGGTGGMVAEPVTQVMPSGDKGS